MRPVAWMGGALGLAEAAAFAAEHEWAGDAGIRTVLTGLGMPGLGLDAQVGSMSGGERRRVALAALLVRATDVLVLDEPTNHLDIAGITWLAAHLRNRRGALVVVTHDRWFLDRIATHMLAFEGDSRVVWFEGNYQDYEADRRRRLGAEADTPHRIKYRKLTR